MDSSAATLACNNASGVGRAGTETLKVDGNVVSTQKARCPAQTLDTMVNIGAAAGTPVDDKDYRDPIQVPPISTASSPVIQVVRHIHDSTLAVLGECGGKSKCFRSRSIIPHSKRVDWSGTRPRSSQP
jgi:hypothetical protein